MSDNYFSQIDVKMFVDVKFLQYSQASEMCDFCEQRSANYARECEAALRLRKEDEGEERKLVLYWCSTCKENGVVTKE